MTETASPAPSRVPSPPASASTSGPRSFSRGFGFLLQGYGAAVLFLMTCTCAGIAFYEADAWQSGDQAASIARQLAEEPSGEGSSMGDSITEDPATQSRRATTVFLIGTALSAFCLVGFGVGMQADRGAFPAWGAGITNTAMILAYGYVGWQQFSASAAWWAILLPAIFMVIVLLLSILSYAAISEVMRNPPATRLAPTVPAEAFPDPWATTQSADASYDEPLKESISKQRKRLRRQLEDLDELEERLDGTTPSSDETEHPH